MTTEKKTLGFLGPEGTHSEEVARWLEREDSVWQPVPFVSIQEAILSVADGRIAYAIVPVENSLEGSVNITLDTLAHEVDLQIEREIIWMVHNQLMAVDKNAPITTIVSHSQPLAQCRMYLKKYYPDAKLETVGSTARAAQVVASGKSGYAAICTRRAGELYHLEPVADEIQDQPGNCTRFVLLKRKTDHCKGSEKTSLICQINGEKAGSLCEVLLDFAAHQVNLTRIESRPARTGLGEYIFFLDMEGTCRDENVKAAIQAVQSKSLWMKLLGSFNVRKIDQNQDEVNGGNSIW